MGVDACIYIKVKSDYEFYGSYLDGTVSLIKCNPDFKIYDIECYQRYYNLTSTRGYWPTISKHLLALLADCNVEEVYYFPDTTPFDKANIFTLEDLNVINTYYVKSSKELRS